MFRYNPGFDLVRKAVGEGWLGDVYYIHASMATRLPADKRLRNAHDPGGMMLDLASHLVDMVVLLLGEPEKVTPFLRHDAQVSDGLADNTLAVFQYPRAMAAVETSAMEPEAFPGRRFKVCGTEGSLTLQPLEPPAARLALARPAGGYAAGGHSISLEDVPRHRRDFADLARCIRGAGDFGYSKEHDYRVQRTLLRASGRES
jgi:predicted dehydrogenase